MFVSNIGLYSSGVASSIAPMKPKPALLTRTSSLPKASIATATAFSGAPALVTSSAVVRAVFGKALAISESVAGSRAVATTWSPRSSAAWASKRPKPVEQPVISQVLVMISLVLEGLRGERENLWRTTREAREPRKRLDA